MDLGEIGIWILIILGLIGTIYGGIYAISWIGCLSSAGQKYDVTVTVQAVERSTRFGDHTNLWVTVYGEQDITYKLIGFHDFELGKTYRIVFIDEQYLCSFIVFWFETRGKVQTIEQVSSP